MEKIPTAFETQKPVAENSFTANAFHLYGENLRGYFRQRLPGRSHHDVDDLVQEVYLRLMKTKNVERICEPLAFLFGISKNVLAEFNRKALHEKQYLSELTEEWAEPPSAVWKDEVCTRLNLGRQLEHAMAQLPPTQADVIWAHKYLGLSYEEVAVELNLSLHTVEKYLTLAKASLRMMAWDL